MTDRIAKSEVLGLWVHRPAAEQAEQQGTDREGHGKGPRAEWTGTYRGMTILFHMNTGEVKCMCIYLMVHLVITGPVYGLEI